MPRTPLCKRLFLCETQPVTVEGVRTILASSCPGTELMHIPEFPTVAGDLHSTQFLLDKALGVSAIAEWCASLREPRPPLVVWGTLFNDAEALRLLQSGVRGLLSKTATPETLVECLAAVSNGSTWIERHLLPVDLGLSHPRNGLTPRERDVLDLVRGGMKNAEIAVRLGIAPGTVKIHLKHVFEKTGIRGRYGLILSALGRDGAMHA